MPGQGEQASTEGGRKWWTSGTFLGRMVQEEVRLAQVTVTSMLPGGLMDFASKR